MGEKEHLVFQNRKKVIGFTILSFVIICLLVAVALILILLSPIFSISPTEEYAFMYDTSKVSSIEIVKTHWSNDGDELIQTTEYVIKDTEKFLNDFVQMECSLRYADPRGIEIGANAVKIIYDTSEYELISWSGQSKYIVGRGLSFYSGVYQFDARQFDALIEYYISLETV